MKLLGVNIDHIATLRQARRTSYPDVERAATIAMQSGADQIVVHLREDRRHIQDRDVELLHERGLPLNLEMSIAPEIVAIACRLKPAVVTLVPERREELTTEGGLDVLRLREPLQNVVAQLHQANIRISFFVDPDMRHIEATRELGIGCIELHTGDFCAATSPADQERELLRLQHAAQGATSLGLKVCAGHGITYDNVQLLVRSLPEVTEYNIGHAIIAEAVFIGLEKAVSRMKSLLNISQA